MAIVRRNAHDMGDKLMGALSNQYLESYEINYNSDESATITVKDDDGTEFIIRVTASGKGQ